MVKFPKLVLLRGKPTSGKSTALHNLKNKPKLKNWAFVDNTAIKEMFRSLGDENRRQLGKLSLMQVLKVVMKTQRNIIIEEMSEDTLRKHINYYIKKYNYKIITFQFEVNLKEANKRNIKRAKDNWHPIMTKKELKDWHLTHKKTFDKNAHLIDCNKLSKKQVVEFILTTLKLK
jgi:predicted kinase